MSAIGKAIRQAIAERLKAADTRAGQRVFTNRRSRITLKQVPAIAIYTASGRSQIIQEAPRQYLRTDRVAVEMVFRGASAADDDVDDELDDFADEVEAVLFLDETFGKTAADSRLVEQEVSIGVNGEFPIGVLRLWLEVDYVQDAPEEGEPVLPRFDKLAATWDLAPADGATDARDEITLDE